jgi:four helix bundle protein
MKTHKDLTVFQKSIDIVKLIYDFTNEFPKEEAYGLTSQIRRAGISIPSNIAEGAARPGKKEFIRFLYISLSSLSEMETQIELAYRLNFCNRNDAIDHEIIHIRRMLLKLIKTISTSGMHST